MYNTFKKNIELIKRSRLLDAGRYRSRFPDEGGQVELIKRSGLFDAEWYRRRYPDVAQLGMTPAEHYLRFGAVLGRDPSNKFHTRHYAESHFSSELGEVNPVVHYIRRGRKAGLSCRDPSRDLRRHAREEVDAIRNKLLSYGFTERPLAELTDLARINPDPTTRALAGREVGLWHMRAKTAEGYRTALGALEKARRDATHLDIRCTLTTLELLCLFFLGDTERASAAYEHAALAGELNANGMLACANLQAKPELRLVWINEVLGSYGLPEIALAAEETEASYDRLTSAEALPTESQGPLVTVLIAAYEAANTLPTALRSLREQTWLNLEILVIDDCSPNPDTAAVVERFAASDPRIRLLRMETNGGAYVARNLGLDQTRGEFVTLHDADDWSHPLKIETQVRYLMEHPTVIGCTSEQARATSDLVFSRWSGQGTLILNNVSSFMWRRRPVREQLGYWDTVRFSADSELIRRVKRVFGARAVNEVKTGPLSFQRDSNTSIIADDVMGINGFFFGARKEYLDAQLHYHASGGPLCYGSDPAKRPFPAPPLMMPDRVRLVPHRHFYRVFAGDFRNLDHQTSDLIERIRTIRKAGYRIGLFEAFEYHRPMPSGDRGVMHSALRAEVDGEAVQVLVFGDKVTCDHLEVVTPGLDLGEYRYLPQITVLGSRKSH